MAKRNRTRQTENFKVYHIGPEQNGLALGAAIKSIVPTAVGDKQEMAPQPLCSVNGNLCLDAARRVKTKDVVKIWNQPLAKPIESSDLRLAYWDEFLIVVENRLG